MPVEDMDGVLPVVPPIPILIPTPMPAADADAPAPVCGIVFCCEGRWFDGLDEGRGGVPELLPVGDEVLKMELFSTDIGPV